MPEYPQVDIAEVERLVLGPGDVLVIKLGVAPPTNQLRSLEKWVGETFPNNKSLIVDDTVELAVIEAANGA